MTISYEPVQQAYQKAHHVSILNPWTPGCFRRLPITGLASVTGAVASIAAATVVLILSDGKPLAAWNFQPTVYLAIATAVANTLIRYSLSEGMAIAWWRRAMLPDTTIADLSRYYEFGGSFKAAILSGRHVNIVAIACMLATIVPLNGPLIQRAARVVVGEQSSNVILGINITSEFPPDYSGWIGRAGPAFFTENFAQVVRQWTVKQPISIDSTGCRGTCRGTILGAGVVATCFGSEIPYKIMQNYTDTDASFQSNVTAFNSRVLWNDTWPGRIDLSIKFKGNPSCAGTLTVSNCTLWHATVEYPVLIDGNASTVSLLPGTTIDDDVVRHIFDAPNLSAQYFGSNKGQGPSGMGGFYLALSNQFASTAGIQYYGASLTDKISTSVYTSGNLAVQYAITNVTTKDNNPSISCETSFSDPTDDMLASTRDLFFRAAIAAANSSTPMQYFSAAQTEKRAVYENHYGYLAGAIAVTLLAIASISATFHGYRHMGRSSTLNPIETGKAFGAPLLRGADGNAELKDVLDVIGSSKVRYGTVWPHSSATAPLYGADSYQSGYDGPGAFDSNGVVSQKPRLQIADEAIVEAPRKMQTYSS